MTFGTFARALGLCSVVVVGAALMIASSPDNNPASMTPTLSAVNFEADTDAPGVGLTPITAHTSLRFAAQLPFRSSKNGLRFSFNAPSPTTLKIVLTSASTGPIPPLPVITAADSPPASTPTTGYARTDVLDATQTPLGWTVTVRPPDSFYSVDTFGVNISVVSLNPSFTGQQLEAPPLTLVMESFRINVTFSGGSGGAGVTSMPGGIACGRGGDCNHDFPPQTGSATSNVTLVPEAHSPDQQTCFTFQGWSGDCSGTNVCHVLLDGTKSVSASAAFDSGQACFPTNNPVCQTPGQATPLCPATSDNPGGIALCDTTGWYCCSKAVPAKAGSNCISGTGPAYGAVQCTAGTPSVNGCQ